jgi:ABC-type phosphate transport system permease subunit
MRRFGDQGAESSNPAELPAAGIFYYLLLTRSIALMIALASVSIGIYSCHLRSGSQHMRMLKLSIEILAGLCA